MYNFYLRAVAARLTEAYHQQPETVERRLVTAHPIIARCRHRSTQHRFSAHPTTLTALAGFAVRLGPPRWLLDSRPRHYAPRRRVQVAAPNGGAANHRHFPQWRPVRGPLDPPHRPPPPLSVPEWGSRAAQGSPETYEQILPARPPIISA